MPVSKDSDGRDAHEDFRRPEIKLDGEPVLAPASGPAEPAPVTDPHPSVPGRAGKPSRRRAALIGGLALLVAAAVAVPLALTRDGDGTPEPAATSAASEMPLAGEQFRTRAVQAFSSVGGVLNIFFQRELRAFREGTSTSAQASKAFTNIRGAVQRTRAELASLEPFEPAPAALVDYRAAATLYLQAIDVALVATRLPSTALQGELRVQAVRLQVLGDRLFDQGGNDLTGFIPEFRPNINVIIQPPAEIPDFTIRDLLPGAPLVPAPESVVPLEPPTGGSRQAVSSWVEQVEALDIPTAQRLAEAIEGTDGPALGALANKLTAAALAVRALDAPASGREDSTRIQLALFVQAEAARTTEAAVALPPGQARARLLLIARTLAVQGDVMWDPRLGPRDTGFSQGLLTVG